MNKEELKAKLVETHRCTAITGIMLMEKIIDELYDNNVIIQRGENRHPDADVLHEWIEGGTLQYKIDSGWVDYAPYSLPNHDHRIKPSEPIYEWQWLVKEFDDTLWYVVGNGKYYTDEEIGNWCGKKRIEQTKRARV